MSETHLRQARQTVKVGLIKTVHELFPGERLKTSYSILDGIFCNLAGSVISPREVRTLDARLRDWIASGGDMRLVDHQGGYYRYQVGDLLVNVVYPALTDTSTIEPFTIIPFSYGFIVDFGDVDRGEGRPLIPPYGLQEAHQENQRWLDQVDIEIAADVNRLIDEGRTLRLISIAEALQEKRLADIADTILAQRRALRVLMIAGPSSSGKTTTAQRLSTQLEVNGFKPVALSLDNYFRDHADTPLDAEGKPDYDTVEALDLPLLTHHLRELIAGRPVEVPTFDFNRGRRSEQTHVMQVGPHEILVIEGIHALNPVLTGDVEPARLFRVYVSALGGLNIDLMNRVPTTEIRLIRRIVRDNMYRGTSPEATIAQWPSVRRGEYENIFKFQEDADVMFNSSLIYEMNALKPLAERALSMIPDDSPHVDTRNRLLNLLTFFRPVDDTRVPLNSIMREFIGGSVYFDPAPRQ